MNRPVLYLSIVLATLLVAGCKEKEETRWDEPMAYYTESIQNYHEAALSEQSKVPSSNQSVYVDFSDGLVQAYNSETNKKLVDYISQKMVGSSIDWFGLGKNHNGVGKLDYANDRDIYNKVISEVSYVDIMAPIEEALKKITASSNDALLITDFEEYAPDGKEQKFAYAKEYFTSWVQAGNSITVYYSKYTEKNRKSKLIEQKNLYFVLFNYGEINENSLLSKFDKAIEGRGAELALLNKFEINPNPYSVSNDYGGKEKTGLTPDESDITDLMLGDKSEVLTYYYNGFLNNGRPYEALEFGISLNDLYEFYFNEKRRFLKNVFLDASIDGSYILKDVNVKVSDVTADYKHYIKCEEGKRNKPVLIKDEGNNDVWDENSKNNLIIQECYIENTTNLRKEYIYKHNPSEVISEIFDYDDSIFSDRLKNSPKEVELITTFHKNFRGKFNSKDQIILRVDFVVENTKENYSEELEDFKWNSVINAANGVNSSLYESIRNTLQKVKPQGILYSYYLKLEPNK